MKKVILKSAKLINTGMWTTEIELIHVEGEEKITHVITRQTCDYDHITKENDNVFKVFSEAYDYFHYRLKEWI